MEQIGQTLTFTAPTGWQYTIREQNGADDDILSNVKDAQNLMNISKFIAAIVVDTTATANHKLTAVEAHKLPALDRYCILLNSRIFSVGEELEFEYDWGSEAGGKVSYTQDLNEFLFKYDEVPSEEMLTQYKDAIPHYPYGSKTTEIEIDLASGKKVKFDLMTGESESKLMVLSLQNQTKNQELIARNLHLMVDGKWERVESFHLFSVRDMGEIRKTVSVIDPTWTGSTDVINPVSGEVRQVNLFSIQGFFYPEEI